MAIGDYIKYKTGLSQRALAAELGMNPNAIQRRFSGAGAMDVETLVKIADRFGLDLLDLMVESGLITTARAKSLRVGGSIRDVSNEDLMGEVLRRMTAAQTWEEPLPAWEEPLPAPVELPAWEELLPVPVDMPAVAPSRVGRRARRAAHSRVGRRARRAASAQAGRAVTGAASGASGEGERKYTAEDYALAAKRGEIYDSEEGFFGA